MTAETADPSPTPDVQLEREEKLRRIHELFDRLPEKQRSALQLRDIEGKSYRETAEVLNVTEENVKVLIFRARQTLRREYERIEQYGL